MPDINKAVKFMVDTANDNSHGYDQAHRNGPDYDCSSLVGTALHNAGFDVSPNSSTWTLEEQLRKAGFKDCRSPWKAGDVHLSTNHHVIMSINEQLNNCYSRIERLLFILKILVTILVIRIAGMLCGYWLYYKGVKLPRWLDILL